MDNFEIFRSNVIGHNTDMFSPFGKKKILYADWIASGRLYGSIENRLQNEVFPYCANTHTESNFTGTVMTQAYHHAKEFIKEQVHASDEDALLFVGNGMTAAICKLQRIMGLRVPERLSSYLSKRKSFFGPKNVELKCKDKDRPVIFITHMEHHSNHTSWLETICDVEIINADENGLVDLAHFDLLLKKYAHCKLKIASVTACSNVTGIETPYYEIAKKIHAAGGLCFVDFACSAPYVDINMHPKEEGAHLDAIFISPHKFLGGPGTPGVLVFNAKLYKNHIPDIPGGGTVYFTSPWEKHKYISSVEDREDGGTPGFLQGIKTAMAFQLKNEMGVENMLEREHEIIPNLIKKLVSNNKIEILAGHHTERLGAISFCIKNVHYNLVVQLLNDYYGIQVRGGCACAGTYGHYLLNIDKAKSNELLGKIESGDLFSRPGWTRLSIHPIMSDAEIAYIGNAILEVAENGKEMEKDYIYDKVQNIFLHKNSKPEDAKQIVQSMFQGFTEFEMV